VKVGSALLAVIVFGSIRFLFVTDTAAVLPDLASFALDPECQVVILIGGACGRSQLPFRKETFK
jgi:hypothetical protein